MIFILLYLFSKRFNLQIKYHFFVITMRPPCRIPPLWSDTPASFSILCSFYAKMRDLLTTLHHISHCTSWNIVLSVAFPWIFLRNIRLYVFNIIIMKCPSCLIFDWSDPHFTQSIVSHIHVYVHPQCMLVYACVCLYVHMDTCSCWLVASMSIILLNINDM